MDNDSNKVNKLTNDQQAEKLFTGKVSENPPVKMENKDNGFYTSSINNGEKLFNNNNLKRTELKESANEMFGNNKYSDEKRIGEYWTNSADHTFDNRVINDVLLKHRNSALNLMYEQYLHNYKNDNTKLPFETWLYTPMTLYRGINPDDERSDTIKPQFMAFTTDRNVANRFASQYTPGSNSVKEIQIRPIDTFGSLNVAGEGEVLVPTKHYIDYDSEISDIKDVYNELKPTGLLGNITIESLAKVYKRDPERFEKYINSLYSKLNRR